MKDLKEEWKNLMKIPVKKVSSQLKEGWNKTKIGTVDINELFTFELKTVVREGQLMAYFVERLEDRDRLVQFNCHNKSRESLVSIKKHILNISVSDTVLTVLEDKITQRKLVAQIANEKFDDNEIEIGRRITRCEGGDLDINCSLRGLNSLIVDKTKLMIFD